MATPMLSLYDTPPIVGVGVVIRKDGQILLGLRKGSHGAGEWGLPGGKVDPGESPIQAAAREVYEEHEILVSGLRPLPFWSYDEFPAHRRHFLTTFVVCEWLSGEPRIVEPDKCEQVGWFSPRMPPRPLFSALGELSNLGLLD
jgi:8-oxo-dGTP diphosphatase